MLRFLIAGIAGMFIVDEIEAGMRIRDAFTAE
jgi:hypothetical protein